MVEVTKNSRISCHISFRKFYTTCFSLKRFIFQNSGQEFGKTRRLLCRQFRTIKKCWLKVREQRIFLEQVEYE